MPPIFEKNCKLKIIEYGEHCNDNVFDGSHLWNGFAGWVRQIFCK